MSIEDFFSEKLSARKSDGLLRQLRTDVAGIDFCSNDYLGLGRSEALYHRIQEKPSSLHARRNGSSGSRLLSGNDAYTEQVERKLSKLFQSEASLIFNSGYSANVAVLSSLPQRNDTILYDELAHASIKDGARLSLAHRHSFRHNDMEDLEKKLAQSRGRIFIAVESIYSMDGDTCPLNDLIALADRFNATIILDEAHSTGVMGADGSGLACSMGLHHRVPVRIYTFGKAMGIHGACVAGSTNLIQYLVNFARPLIYTTALSPHSICAIDCAFDFLRENIVLQNNLQKKVDLYLAETAALSRHNNSTSAIQTVICAGNDHARETAHALQQQAFDIRPILSPTVPLGSERLRICLHVYNEDTDIIRLAQALTKLQAKR